MVRRLRACLGLTGEREETESTDDSACNVSDMGKAPDSDNEATVSGVEHQARGRKRHGRAG